MYQRSFHINWAKDKNGDKTSAAVRKLDEEINKIYGHMSSITHSVNGHKHTGEPNEAPRIIELWRYE